MSFARRLLVLVTAALVLAVAGAAPAQAQTPAPGAVTIDATPAVASGGEAPDAAAPAADSCDDACLAACDDACLATICDDACMAECDDACLASEAADLGTDDPDAAVAPAGVPAPAPAPATHAATAPAATAAPARSLAAGHFRARGRGRLQVAVRTTDGTAVATLQRAVGSRGRVVLTTALTPAGRRLLAATPGRLVLRVATTFRAGGAVSHDSWPLTLAHGAAAAQR